MSCRRYDGPEVRLTDPPCSVRSERPMPGGGLPGPRPDARTRARSVARTFWDPRFRAPFRSMRSRPPAWRPRWASPSGAASGARGWLGHPEPRADHRATPFRTPPPVARAPCRSPRPAFSPEASTCSGADPASRGKPRPVNFALTVFGAIATQRGTEGDVLQGAAADCNSAGETHAWFDSRVAHRFP